MRRPNVIGLKAQLRIRKLLEMSGSEIWFSEGAKLMRLDESWNGRKDG